jgi:hypothetical protein
MQKKFDPKQIVDMAAKAAMQPNVGIPQGQPQIPLDVIQKGEDMLCTNKLPVLDENGKPKPGKFETCNNSVYVEGRRMKYVSPIISPTGTHTIGTVIIGNMCAKCGKIFNPDEWLRKRISKGGKDANP